MINKSDKFENSWKSKQIHISIISSASFLSLFGIIITSLILLLSTIKENAVKPGEITSLILYTGNIFILIMDVFNNIIIFSELGNSLKCFNNIFTKENKKSNLMSKENISNWYIELKKVGFNYE